jgi:hypothetical protein
VSGGGRIELDEAAARRTVQNWLGFRGIRASASVDSSPEGIRVVLRSNMPTSFLGLIGIESVSVAAVARAEPVPGPP